MTVCFTERGSMSCRLVLILMLMMTSGVSKAGWVVDGELTGTYDNNVSRAERERDILRDESALANVSVGWRTQPTFNTGLTLRGFVEGEAYKDITTLNRTTAGGQTILRWQPVQGFMEPVYQFSVMAQVDKYDVDQRSSAVFTAQAFASRHLNDRIILAYGVEGVKRRSNGTVFDTSNGRAFLNMDFELTQSIAAYAGYSYLRGDTFSSAQLTFCNGLPASDIYGLIQASSALEPDAAFNKKFCGSWVAYRLPASSHSFSLGLNKSFGHNLSVDVSVQKVLVYAKGDNDYQRMLVRASLLTRF
jgi:hypothetical protein